MKILAVDDHKSMRDFYEHFFNFEGHDITTASSPDEALEILKSQAFEVIISDYEMNPHMTGAEFIEKVISNGIQVRKIIFVTGHSEKPREIVSLMNNHAHISYIQKDNNIHVHIPEILKNI